MAMAGRANFFSASEQEVLLEAYEEFKPIITKKGNTQKIIKLREQGWQAVADRLNA